MIAELTSRPIFGVTICILAYIIGVKIKDRFDTPIANPMVIASLLIIGLLYALRIPLENFLVGGDFITMILAPATAALAVPMFARIDIIKRNRLPILVGCVVGAATSVISVFVLSRLFGLPSDVTVSLLPKSVTTAIASEVSGQIGGIVPLTVAAVCFTGVFGAIMCPYFIKWFHIDNPIAAGLAIGASCHALGTSKAIEIGETEGIMSGIAIGICGLATVFMLIFFGI